MRWIGRPVRAIHAHHGREGDVDALAAELSTHGLAALANECAVEANTYISPSHAENTPVPGYYLRGGRIDFPASPFSSK